MVTMKIIVRSVLLISVCITFALCHSSHKKPKSADLIILGGEYFTADSVFEDIEAIAIHSDTILAVGTRSEIQKFSGDLTQVIDASGSFIMPGFIEGHGHFLGLGKSLTEINLLGVDSWEKLCQLVADKAESIPAGSWITGRGWHQEKFTDSTMIKIAGYPLHIDLSRAAPNHPVMLHHASGHALIANESAMQTAGIGPESRNPFGGQIIRDEIGNPTGIFEERAMQLITKSYQDSKRSESLNHRRALLHTYISKANTECIQKGITSFQDAGISVDEVNKLSAFIDSNGLDVRLWMMLREPFDSIKNKLNVFPWIGRHDNHLTVRAIKSEIDGALGAYGAWLLKPYDDKPGFDGHNTTPLKDLKSMALLAKKHEMQLCVHAIGDKGNQIVLNMCEEIFKPDGLPSTLRWRIEHAQHLDTSDIPRFAQLGVIAAMQAVHCTSDAPFVVKRLGEQRSHEGAYAWRALIDAGAVVTNGTDAPVEDVDPIKSFYASVTRKRPGYREAFMPHQAMTRHEALKSYTINNAFAAFEDNIKGSLTPGKLADITILDTNLLSCAEEEILDAKVLYTLIGGRIAYQKQ